MKQTLLLSLLVLAACQDAERTKPKKSSDPTDHPTTTSASSVLQGLWKVQSAQCGSDRITEMSEQHLLVDLDGALGAHVVRYLLVEKDDTHVCRTLRDYQPAQIVTDESDERGGPGTYNLFLRAIRNVCQHIRNGQLDAQPYSDEATAAIDEEVIQVELKKLDGGELELRSQNHPLCPSKEFVVTYRKT